MATRVEVCWRFSCILVIFSFILCSSGEPLFKPQDDIIILNSDNLNQTIRSTETLLLVTFYSSWCGHCHHFAPIFRNLSVDIRAWAPVVQLGAIDCAEDENHPGCTYFQVQGYPTVKVFEPHPPLSSLGVVYENERSVEEMRSYIVQHLASPNYTTQHKQLTRLQPLRSLEVIWQDVTSSAQHTVILFEEEESTIGQELILDYWSHSALILRRMLKKDVTQFGVKRFPSLYLIEKGASFFNLMGNGSTRADFSSALRRLLKLPDEPREAPGEAHKIIKDTEATLGKGDQQARNRPPSAVYHTDLLTAVRYSLTRDVSSVSTLTGDSLQAVKDYVHVLAKYLPLSRPATLYLRRLDDYLTYNNVQSIHSEEWSATLHKLQDSTAYLPDNTSYIGCRGSEPRYRGYSCGLWTIFHSLTVNSVLDYGEDMEFNPKEVLLTMKGYITNIFGCKTCGENFQKEYAAVDVHVPDDAILSLWKLHNNVNRRLHGDLTEDPFYPKVQFPTPTLCSDCHLGEFTDGELKPKFDEDEVLEFLKTYFSRNKTIGEDNVSVGIATVPESTLNKENVIVKDGSVDEWRKTNNQRKTDLSNHAIIRAAKKNTDLRYIDLNDEDIPYDKTKIDKLKKLERETRNLDRPIYSSSSGLNGLDLSMCAMFYILCTIIIIAVYFHFTVRKRMKPSCCLKDLV